jgi:Antibiotic biosynthesis monooxygenase
LVVAPDDVGAKVRTRRRRCGRDLESSSSPTDVALRPHRVRLGLETRVRWLNRRKECQMFAAIRYYRTDPDSIESVVRRVKEGFVPIIREMPGFVSYFVLAPRQGEIVSVSIFEEQQGAQESNMKAEEWLRQNLSELLPSPEFADGQVVVYEAK